MRRREIGFILAMLIGLMIGNFLKNIKVGVVAALLLLLLFSMIAIKKITKK